MSIADLLKLDDKTRKIISDELEMITKQINDIKIQLNRRLRETNIIIELLSKSNQKLLMLELQSEHVIINPVKFIIDERWKKIEEFISFTPLNDFVNKSDNEISESSKLQSNINLKQIMILDTEFCWAKKFEMNKLIEIAYVIIQYDETTKEIKVLKSYQTLIKPEGFFIWNSAIHNIKHKTACDEGIYLSEALGKFLEDVANVDLFVAHNAVCDINVIRIELAKLDIESVHKHDKAIYMNIIQASKRSDDDEMIKNTTSKQNIANMKKFINSEDYQVIGGANVSDRIFNRMEIYDTMKYGKAYYKMTKQPKLIDLFVRLSGTIYEQTHRALDDVFICMYCYISLKYDEHPFLEDILNSIDGIRR